MHHLRLLVADDERDTVLTLSAILRDAGHSVHGVYNGDDVLKAVHLMRPDAIILDIEMPGMSGYAIAQQLKSIFYGARAPLLIAISGKWVRPSEKILALVVGFDHHCTKPCDPQHLLKLLEPLAAGETAP